MTPDAATNQELMLDVGNGHQLYVHDWGYQQANIPILVLHGGPGGGTSDRKKLLFNPEVQRVIFHDQRGAGKSLPYGSLEHNTTQDLIEDIVTILDHFNIAKCILVGGSWGSTLALCFGITHPDRVVGMVIDGVWTATKSENAWIDQGGLQKFYPDAWAAYVASVPPEFADDPSKYHIPRILSEDMAAAKESAQSYETLEAAAISLDDRHVPINSETYDHQAVRIEVKYLSNGCFIPDNHIFDNAHIITMPVAIVQGRYDMVCPPETAYKLHNLLPNSQLHFTTSGHVAEHESWSLIRLLIQQIGDSQNG